MKEKKMWVKPELIVLVERRKPGEVYLQKCQESGSGSRLEGVHGQCTDFETCCSSCFG